jgi:alkylated DNA repair protein alkB family protein 1
MEDTLPAHFASSSNDTPEMAVAKRFISTARININARQVFPPGFKRPPVSGTAEKAEAA